MVDHHFSSLLFVSLSCRFPYTKFSVSGTEDLIFQDSSSAGVAGRRVRSNSCLEPMVMRTARGGGKVSLIGLTFDGSPIPWGGSFREGSRWTL